jgi:Icc-related predicted phosphoesterase
MKRFVITGRLDGQQEALAKLVTLVRKRRPDGVLFAGGIVGTNPASHTEKLKQWTDAFDGLGELGVFAAAIPGAADVPLREFLRLATDAEVAHANLHVVHATLFVQGGVAVGGLGGELTEAEEETENRLRYARGSAEYFLRALWQAEQPHKILLLSEAPPGPLGGENGNRIAGDFIDSYHPSLCAVAGTTERRGFQQIAHTLVVNPGRMADGSAAWLDWSRPKGEQIELLQL